MRIKKEKQEKANVLNNFLFAFKTIYKIDKTFIVQKLFVAIFNAVIVFFYAYILKVAIEGFESGLSFRETILEVLVVIIIAFVMTLTIRLVDASWYRPHLTAMKLNHQTSLRTLDIDYEILERPETLDALEKANRSLGGYNGVLGLLQRSFWSIQYVITFLIASVIIVSVNWILVLIIVLLASLKVIIENKDQRRRKKEVFDVSAPIWRRINYSDSISSTISIAKDLRVYKMDAFINEERNLAVNDLIEMKEKDLKKSLLSRSYVELLAILDGLFLYGFMIYEVLYNNMSIANFTFMVASVFQIIRSLYNLIKNNSYILLNSLQTNDYRKFMNIDYQNPNYVNNLDSQEINIEFKGVYYSYYMQEGYALEDVSFKINAKEKVALVGYNGAGKTTIVKLLTGLYKPTKGTILLNGIDITTIKRESLEKVISPVFQETIFFPFSIAENISMEREDIDFEKINDSLKLFKLDKKISALPEGIKTVLSRDLDDKGVDLSGGESQKLSLARALYKDNQLFILDEPTSALDAISEYELYNNFSEITKESTTIFISHRLSSTRFCDKILLLDKGKLIEEGSHDALMKEETTYKSLFMMQSKYYQDEDNEHV